MSYAQVMYCSETCRDAAESGHHKLECRGLSYFFIQCPFEPHAQLAFRIVCKVGPEELYRLFVTRDPSYFDVNEPFATQSSCKYESDSYLSVHHLKNHSQAFGKDTLFRSGFVGLLILSVLEKTTNFFESAPEETRNDFKIFVAAIIARLTEILFLNGVQLQETKFQGVTLEDFQRLKARLAEDHSIMRKVLTDYDAGPVFVKVLYDDETITLTLSKEIFLSVFHSLLSAYTP